MRKKTISLIAALCLSLMLSGCGHELAGYRPIGDINDLEGRKIGVNLAWAADYVLSPRDGDDLILYRYDTTADLLMALYYHQIDALCVDNLVWLVMDYTNGDALRRIPEPVTTDGYVACMSPSREALRDDFNRFLAYYHGTEEFAGLYGRIMDFDGVEYEPGEYIHPNGNGEKIKIAFITDYFPYCFSEADGTISGYDIEIMYAFADYCDYDIELIETSEENMYYGVETGRYDMGIGTLSLSYAPEMEIAGVHVTDPYYEMPIYLVELKEGAIPVIGDEFYADQ